MLWNHLIIYENDYHVWWSLHLTERSTFVEKLKRGRLDEDIGQRETMFLLLLPLQNITKYLHKDYKKE